MKTNTASSSTPMLFAGIDYHKRYSVVHVLDAEGATVKKRILGVVQHFLTLTNTHSGVMQEWHELKRLDRAMCR
jgi:hypothetical protein